ncbi:hypothetical protein CBR_g50765 [Chara braunii]|uniref:Calmodulin binding protein C-terminal domain-containing protein n=1 Tax=Chara braunii TaxID=69332 RepID=A0A388K5R5_CHABU|nr:hypothetical protein CBR_g50765 [Chara braunii]|eukprot:GBG65404.1 hypothetical protein CBR_g50765 [Chara braunii]
MPCSHVAAERGWRCWPQQYADRLKSDSGVSSSHVAGAGVTGETVTPQSTVGTVLGSKPSSGRSLRQTVIEEADNVVMLKRPTTRCATNFEMLQSRKNLKTTFDRCVCDKGWVDKMVRNNQLVAFHDVTGIVHDKGGFWRNVQKALDVMQPVVELLCTVDGQGATILKVYFMMDRVVQDLRALECLSVEKHEAWLERVHEDVDGEEEVVEVDFDDEGDEIPMRQAFLRNDEVDDKLVEEEDTLLLGTRQRNWRKSTKSGKHREQELCRRSRWMSHKIWESLIDHAQTCVLSGKLCVYDPDQKKQTCLVFNNIYQFLGITADGQFIPATTLSDDDKVYVDRLIKSAYENWEKVIEFEGSDVVGHDMNIMRPMWMNPNSYKTAVPAAATPLRSRGVLGVSAVPIGSGSQMQPQHSRDRQRSSSAQRALHWSSDKEPPAASTLSSQDITCHVAAL